jgi:plasmid maintenance system antidote protein VapI
MPALSANSVYAGGVSIPKHSQIANVFATPEFRNTGNDRSGTFSHHANMDDVDDKNGGPNHLRAWMAYRKIKGSALAEALGGNVTPGMVSDLANSKRALSAKWLRRLAPILNTTPGMLLDHDPHELPSDIMEIWGNADAQQRRQIVDVARALVRDGTNG